MKGMLRTNAVLLKKTSGQNCLKHCKIHCAIARQLREARPPGDTHCGAQRQGGGHLAELDLTNAGFQSVTIFYFVLDHG